VLLTVVEQASPPTPDPSPPPGLPCGPRRAEGGEKKRSPTLREG
jgi:hypothetical protein